tara:strand:- start:3287 stop:4540 length:1254 start_codon:yes stop_codon:yes gene_type:complete
MTITQEPTFPNGTQADLIYVIDGVYASSPQHKYVCRLSTAGETLSTIKQVSNQFGYGVFEVSRLLDDHMGYDVDMKISGSSPYARSTNNNIGEFEIAFAEEYGSSPSSSIVTTPYISGSVSGSQQVIPAVVEKDAGYFNWQSGSYDALTNAPNIVTVVNSDTILDSLIVSSSDYATLSTLNNVYDDKVFNYIDILFYNASLALQATLSTTVSNIPGDDISGKLVHIGVGPKNLRGVTGIDTYLDDPAQYPYYAIRLRYTDDTGFPQSDLHLYNNTSNCYKGTNFAFINKLGVMDYYRATLVDTQMEKFNRETYKAPYINYSTMAGTIDYDSTRRGTTQYYASFENDFTAETNWLTQEYADYLFELFESPSVYVQQGDQWVGAVLTNGSEQYKTNPKGQKIFKFTIQYRLSNSKHSRY